MDPIARLVRISARRATVVALTERVMLLALLLLAAALALRIAEQLLLLQPDWTLFWAAAAGAALLIAVVWALSARPSRDQVARRIDQRIGLPQSVSTAAWAASRPGSPWSDAVRAQAHRAARGVDPARVYPLRPRAWWWALPALAAAFTALAFTPQFDLRAALASDEQRAEEQQQYEVRQARAEIQQVEADVQDALSELPEELRTALEQLELDPPDAEQPATPEDARADALARLTSMQDKLHAEMRASADTRRYRAMRDQMSRLRTPRADEPRSRELAEALQRADFQRARELLNKLRSDAPQMSEGERGDASRNLSDLASQLDRIASDNQAMRDALEQLGLDPDLANLDSEALRRLLENMPELSAEQREQLLQALESLKMSAEEARRLAEQLRRLSESLENLSPEQMQELLEQMDDLAQCQGNCQGMGRAAAQLALAQAALGGEGSPPPDPILYFDDKWAKAGPGGGGAGRSGTGGAPQPPADDNAFDAQRQRAGKQGAGDEIIIARQFIEGAPVRGEATQTFEQVLQARAADAAGAIESQQIPREYQDAVKRYFATVDAPRDTPQSEPEPDPDADDAGT